MKKILIIDNSENLVNQLKNAFRKYHIFDDIDILKASSYNEASLLIAKNPSNIEIAVVSKSLPNVADGKAIMLTSTNAIPSIVLFDSYNSEDKLDNKLLNIHGVLEYFEKNNPQYIYKIVDYIHKSIRNSTYTALVVDDSLLYREKFKKDIEKLNLTVLVAENGKEALDIFRSKKHNISLLITDYNMPEMDGIELVKELRKEYENDKLAIIAISIDDEQKTLTKFIRVGANDYLNKPYSTEELTVRVNSNLNTLEMFEKINNLANRDFLTGAFNRRYFFESSSAIISKNSRKNGSF